ncbi:plant/protein [Rhynchospora pubera]|uniref:Plant/protein n=1 Tax=Rhynchospora pubera TaxID=906938 RepID=A0AAV8D1L8_9POAL|nr:plant/protein [Rhynchospora pubera]
MATGKGGSHNRHRPKPVRFLLLLVSAIAIGLLLVFLSFPFSFSFSVNSKEGKKKYLYWGSRIDCPGKCCDQCAGLAHQESSLRCALEEALVLNRIFVMPSRMCLSTIHNTKGILHASNATSTDERWEENSCAMDSLYDIQLISQTVPVILDNSDAWFQVLSEGKRLGKNGIMHVKGVSRAELKENRYYSNALLINRTASPLAWFAECKDRKNRRSVRLPYTLLPTMASKRLRDAADKIKELLGDYDAINVRRGDRLKTRTDKSGVKRSQFPHLDRDTQPQFIQKRIAKWVPPGRTLFIASNERKPGFFTPLSSRYKLAYSSNYSYMLDPLIENNYQLFMVERLIFQGARTFIKTFKEDEGDLFLTDDPKKTSNNWQIPVYTEEKEN